LLAANDHSDPGEPSLYNYLEIHRAKKELEETTRLLYVGATRAVSQLTLTASLKYNEEKEAYATPSSSSLLGRIWPIVRDQIVEHEPSVVAAMEAESTRLGLRRIAITDLGPEPRGTRAAISDTGQASGNIPRRSANRVDRAVGTVVHLVLEHLGGNGVLPQSLAGCYQAGWSKRQWQFELRRQGVSGAELSSALQRVESSIVNVLEDDRGRWLFASTHRDASTELAITVQLEKGNPGKLIIDRTFVDAVSAKRWIVDYKNSQPAAGEVLADFLAREEAAYLPQLTQYRNALRGLAEESIVCALYFTALGHMHPVDSLSD
jgi:ATP-dependent exoDNAse (exonuclease V) beta subunit